MEIKHIQVKEIDERKYPPAPKIRHWAMIRFQCKRKKKNPEIKPKQHWIKSQLVSNQSINQSIYREIKSKKKKNDKN